MPFPVVKLAYLAMKQVSKPIARTIKLKAKTSPFLRNYILLPPAQIYHTMETSIKLRLLGMGKATNVKPLNEEMAIELAAEMLGELIVFSFGTGIIYIEYRRQTNKDQNKEDQQNDRLGELEGVVKDLGLQVEEQNTQLRELTRLLYSVNGSSERTKAASYDGPVPETIRDSKSGTVLIVSKS